MRLEIKGVRFSYNSLPVLKSVSLTLEDKEILGIVGPNGSGKTTLLKCINRILKPHIGSILIEEENINSFEREEIARKIGYVPQIEVRSFPTIVFDMILMGRKPHFNFRPTTNDLKVVSDVIKTLGLQELAMRDIGELSGGQRQKVIIARALAQQPGILLLDEPTSNLDLKHQLEVLNIVKEQVRNGISAVMAIHDLNLAGRYSDKLIMLKNGKIFASGGLEILSSENIESVYGVKVTVKNYSKKVVVIPEEPITAR